jgi:hypothetical protein
MKKWKKIFKMTFGIKTVKNLIVKGPEIKIIKNFSAYQNFKRLLFDKSCQLFKPQRFLKPYEVCISLQNVIRTDKFGLFLFQQLF